MSDAPEKTGIPGATTAPNPPMTGQGDRPASPPAGTTTASTAGPTTAATAAAPADAAATRDREVEGRVRAQASSALEGSVSSLRRALDSARSAGATEAHLAPIRAEVDALEARRQQLGGAGAANQPRTLRQPLPPGAPAVPGGTPGTVYPGQPGSPGVPARPEDPGVTPGTHGMAGRPGDPKPGTQATAPGDDKGEQKVDAVDQAKDTRTDEQRRVDALPSQK